MREINPMNTKRAESWKLYIDAPMPMVTIFKTLDISNLIYLKKKGYRLNMLMCYCIGLSANESEEFKMLPVGRKMAVYDKIGINVIVANQRGGINSCDIPFTLNLKEFSDSYSELTEKVYTACENYEIEEHMIVGTSCLAGYEIDGAVNMYSGVFNNPFIIWGKYRHEQDNYKLRVSFQFHHVQMDGLEACEFLDKLQTNINGLTCRK